MQPSVSRAAAFAAIATIALTAPLVGALAAVPFALIAVLGRVVTDGPLFDLFARPSDRVAGELRTLVGFSLAATALALLTSLAGLPVGAFVATLLIVAYGNLVERVACERRDTEFRRAVAFSLGGSAFGVAGLGVSVVLAGGLPASTGIFIAVTGGVLAALIRAVIGDREDPVVMVSVALLLWLFAGLGVRPDPVLLGIAVGIAGAFGYVSWAMGTASVTGMLTGVVISLLTIVLGGFGWFAVLIAFFGVGGFASKYRLDEKRDRGVAEANEGARGGHNVLGNAAVALLAVVGFGAGSQLPVDPAVFLFAFAGSVATAMGDTLSSEFGVLFGRPRLITTLEPVEAGTDGGVTLAGEAAGLVGAVFVAGIAAALLGVSAAGAAVIAFAGLAGTNADSLFGATLEDEWIGNQAVNFLATLAGAGVAVGAAVWLGLVG